MVLVFEWDPEKDAVNERLHGVGFLEALTVFGDPLAGIRADERHSVYEERFVILGRSAQDRLLVVMFTERDEDRVRIFSARRATARERKSYEEDHF